MKKSNLSQKVCQGSLKILGDYWTLRIVDALQDGQLRFCELQRNVDNVNPVTLTNRLKKLEESKLISRSEETVDKVSVCYQLTENGRAVLPVLAAINNFSDKVTSRT